MTDAAASPRAFRRAFTAVVVVLVLVCGGLLAAAGSQGPRLVRTDVDPLAVVQQSRQRLVLAANRPLQPVDASRVAAALAAAEIDPDRRPQTLAVGEWLRLRETLGPIGEDRRGRGKGEH